ncbi:MAG: glycosyltransferase family 2 protein [Solobacterium sp.]|nr:glycosyltransferase family 2 protein [Solobacterium sp.]
MTNVLCWPLDEAVARLEAEGMQVELHEAARIEVIHQRNQGLSAARNTGIEHARGEWLMFVDSDDFVEKNFCEAALRMVTENDCQIAVFAFEKKFSNEPITFYAAKEPYLGKLTREQAMMGLAVQEIYDYAWNKIYHRSLFKSVRYPVGEIFEDIAVTYLLFNQAEAVYVSAERLYWYRTRKGSILDASYTRLMVEKLRQRDKEHAFFREHYPEAAEKLEELIFMDELDACIGGCLVPELSNEYQMMKKRLLSHTQVYRKYGIKKWVFVRSISISDHLFKLVTEKRRKRRFEHV